MLTPSELYNSYTNNPCTEDLIGAGTPYDLYKLSTFLKQVKYPCLKNVPGYSGIRHDNTDWKNNIALPYKYLEIFDPQLFSEIQPTITAGTSHAVRNACDVARACSLVSRQADTEPFNIVTYEAVASGWIARGATEHMFAFGENYITNCLFALGPDLVPYDIAASGRGTGCNEMDCLPPWKGGTQGSALGASFSCESQGQQESSGKECTPCGKCPEDDDTHPCCDVDSCVKKMNNCCGDPPGSSPEFIFDASYPELKFGHKQFQTVAPSGRVPADSSNTIRHMGCLLRQKYGGYANLQDVSENLWTCPRDIFIKYIQKNNGYNYSLNESIEGNHKITRVKTISYVDSTQDIKALLYNGYGIVLNTNIGFSKTRDSRGLAYPDKIWYHSYAIIGYDDTHTEFNECVFIFANSWGDWNSGGHPSWGKLPVGCFLVTESHLHKMLNLERIDKAGCRKVVDDNGDTIEEACTEDNSCVPWECGKNQKPMGMAFVLCLSDKLERRPFQYNKFILNKNNTQNIKEKRFISSSGSIYYLNGATINSIIRNNDLIEPSDVTGWTNYLTNTPEQTTMDHLKDPTLAPNGIDFKTSTINSGNHELYSIASYQNIFNAKENMGSLFNHISLSEATFTIEPDKNYSFNTVDGLVITGGTPGEPSKNLSINGMQVSNISLEGMFIKPGSNELKNAVITTNVFTFNNCDISINIQSNTGGIIKGEHGKLTSKIYGNIIVENNSGIMPDAQIFGNAFFNDKSINNGTISQDAVFMDSENGMNGVIKGNAFFIDNSVNRGIIYGSAAFDSTSANSGIVLGDTITIEEEE
jgi:hypothetical protein